MHHKSSFGAALRKIRQAKGITQEDFSLVSSRTYISALERGLKSPTLDKVELLASTLGISPLTLLVLAYKPDAEVGEVLDQIKIVKSDLESLFGID